MSSDNNRAGAQSQSIQSRFGLAWFNVLLLLIAFFLLRLVLYWKFGRETSVPASEILKAFLVGLHLDLLAALLFSFPLIIWLAIIPNSAFGAVWHRRTVRM